MCGIAGYSLSARSDVDRTLAAQSLLAGIAERGADAVGYAHRGPRGRLRGRDEAADARRASCSTGSPCPRAPPSSSSTSVTTRRATRRSPPTTIPSATGRWSGIHNGIILNDDELLEPLSCARSRAADDRRLRGDLRPRRPLAERPARARGPRRAPWRRPGSTRACPDTIFAARGVGRPLWIGKTASTSSSSPRRRPRSRSSSATRASGSEARDRRRHVPRDLGGTHHARGAFPARSQLSRPDRPPCRSRAARRRVVPRAARRARRRG